MRCKATFATNYNLSLVCVPKTELLFHKKRYAIKIQIMNLKKLSILTVILFFTYLENKYIRERRIISSTPFSNRLLKNNDNNEV